MNSGPLNTLPEPYNPYAPVAGVASDGSTVSTGGVFPPPYDYSGGMSKSSFAKGGLAALAGGGYLNGKTDGMTDEIPANIDGVQEARLSHGEFVWPADVVSHLGNGNSEAGAAFLERKMEEIRRARTGNPQQGRQINPERAMKGVR
jgi:hypothetical protein